MSADLMDHDSKGVVGITISALAVPFVALRSLGSQPASARVGLTLAIAPLILMYEVLAVPLVAGTLLLGVVLVTPFAVIAAVGSLLARVMTSLTRRPG